MGSGDGVAIDVQRDVDHAGQADQAKKKIIDVFPKKFSGDHHQAAGYDSESETEGIFCVIDGDAGDQEPQNEHDAPIPSCGCSCHIDDGPPGQRAQVSCIQNNKAVAP